MRAVLVAMAQPSLLPDNASPKFRQALELLIQAHVEELAKASFQEPVTEKPANKESLFQEPGAETSIVVPSERSPRSPKQPLDSQALPVVTQDAATAAAETKSKDDDAPKGMFACLRPWMPSIGAHGHSNEVAMFGNVKEQLKDKHEIDEFEYDVTNYYKTTGIVQSIARSDHFGHLALLFICLNAVFLGVDSDLNKAESANDANLEFIICENIFCVFFTFEVTMRFLAFRYKRDCLRDTWFKFDSVLVIIMVLETWVLFLVVHLTGAKNPLPAGPMKLLRLLKLARMVRIMRSFPEIMTMIKGMMVATKPVSSSMAMLVGIIYVFAITMHMLCKDDLEVFEYWGTVGRCMMTLFANGTAGDSIGTVTRGIARNVPALCAFLLFVILSAVTITNMLVGVLCEVVSHVAEAEKESAALSKLKNTLLVMLKELDEDGDGVIEKEELIGILNHEDALEVLADLDIDMKYFVDYLDMLYEKTSSRTIPEIMQLLLDNQGQRTPTLKDTVLLHNFTRWSIRREIRQSLAAFALAMPRITSQTDSAKMKMLEL